MTRPRFWQSTYCVFYVLVAQRCCRIEDKAIRDLVTSMIQLDPSARLQASEYLSKYRGSAFPLSFSTFLHQYTLSLTDPNNPSMDPDTRVDKIYQEFDKISHLMGLRFLDDTPHIGAIRAMFGACTDVINRRVARAADACGHAYCPAGHCEEHCRRHRHAVPRPGPVHPQHVVCFISLFTHYAHAAAAPR